MPVVGNTLILWNKKPWSIKEKQNLLNNIATQSVKVQSDTGMKTNSKWVKKELLKLQNHYCSYS